MDGHSLKLGAYSIVQQRNEQPVLVSEWGFSLLEVLIAMAISSVLLIGASRFLPAMHHLFLRQAQQQALEDEVWQRLYTVAKHLKRAGYCAGNCRGNALTIMPDCVIVRWDGNSNGVWEENPAEEADITGFRLHNGVLETLRGALHCDGKGWDKMTDPAWITVTRFAIQPHTRPGYPPELSLALSAQLRRQPQVQVDAQFHVTGYNL